MALPHPDLHYDDWGVLLYYKFVVITEPARVVDFYNRLCTSHSLRGRVRVAFDGVNVTVTGTLPALYSHVSAIRAHPLFAFPSVDFKLSPAPPFHAVPPHLAHDCGFSSLSVRLVPHLITIASNPPPVNNAGPHVSPHQFHSLLELPELKPTVLIDARNIYETRIGKFHPPSEVQFFDPLLRQYSDLPGWLDAHQDQLRNKRVLMYCTGGVRCELASSYLRSKGKDFEDVLQLSGGIHRYLEVFADGGYFKGKNFVFDHRLAVASSSTEIVGRCLLCKAPFDDYSARNRCSLCRLLVLICTTCQGSGSSPASPVKYICELCEVNQRAFGSSEARLVDSIKNGAPSTEVTTSAMDLKRISLHGWAMNRKLRLLCLHGFRQNASSFQGRLGSLKKKLKHIADFVFVDAPHSLPFIQQERTEDWSDVGLERDLKGTFCRKPTRKNAWLISPGDVLAKKDEESGVEGERRNIRFEPWQYETQTEGWEQSWKYLQSVFRDLGPFDGVLGFSQGASVAAALCSLRHNQLSKSDGMNAAVHFRFVVLCSGYSSPVPLHAKMMSSEARIRCPSLHIYGGQDRQIGSEMSEQLVSLFHKDERVIIKHEFGHIIPTKPKYIEQYVHFLSRFLE